MWGGHSKDIQTWLITTLECNPDILFFAQLVPGVDTARD